MKNPWSLAGLAAAAILLCHPAAFASDPACPLIFPQHHICADLTWISPPIAGVFSSFQLRFWPQDGNQQADAFTDPSGLPSVQLWMRMEGHEHGSSPVRITRTQPGVFSVERVFFLMRGGWQIRISLPGDPSAEQIIVPISILRP